MNVEAKICWFVEDIKTLKDTAFSDIITKLKELFLISYRLYLYKHPKVQETGE